MYEAIEHWNQYKQEQYQAGPKYIQKPAEKPGGMILDELIEEEIKSGEYTVIEEQYDQTRIKTNVAKYTTR